MTRKSIIKRFNERFYENRKFPEGYTDQQTPDEGQRPQQPKHFNNNDKDEGNSLNE